MANFLFYLRFLPISKEFIFAEAKLVFMFSPSTSHQISKISCLENSSNTKWLIREFSQYKICIRLNSKLKTSNSENMQ